MSAEMTPKLVEKICAEDSSRDICKDSRPIPQISGNMAEYSLSHIVMRTYIEHINCAVMVEYKVAHGCNGGAGKVDPRAF